MATGAYDANGIWQYGESDNIAPFSTTLNKLAGSTSSAITADRSRLATLEAGSLAGLIPVKPTSVIVTGGTAAVNAIGMVTFTGCTGVTLSGVFTGNFKNYRVVMTSKRVSGGSAGISFIRLASSGTALGTGYSGGYSGFTYGSSSIANSGGTDGIYISPIYYAPNSYSVDIYSPAEAIETKFLGSGLGSISTAGVYTLTAGDNNSVSAFDGLQLNWNVGNWSGSAQIFGYND